MGHRFLGSVASSAGKHFFVDTTNQNETNVNDSRYHVQHSCRREPLGKYKGNPVRSEEQEFVWQLIPFSRHTETVTKRHICQRRPRTSKDAHAIVKKKMVRVLGQPTKQSSQKRNARRCERSLPTSGSTNNELHSQGKERDKVGQHSEDHFKIRHQKPL